eukprot:TRINITY_DN11064_c0_g2_i1.p1 TRINITY_DN11064_c0_g2~~TRINITY_DN11064_c0_g2_i1.p1  ORF type:complete len:337 (-),score=39.56 TRINITY_DN11064_c0_g2_i1:273-1205(-)
MPSDQLVDIADSRQGRKQSHRIPTCPTCRGTGKLGLLGPGGFGLVSRPCTACTSSARSPSGAISWLGATRLGTPFIARGKNDDLWRSGGEVIWELRSRHCNVEFNPGGPELRGMLKDIWDAALPGIPIPDGADLFKAEHWKQLGFQSCDPRTDVRAGRFALDQLHFLAVMYPERLQQLVMQSRELEYFFAISCFNLTQTLLLFFDLMDGVAMNPVPGAGKASVQQLKHFARMCSNSPYSAVTVLNELFTALVERLHKTWKEMRAAGDCNVMQHFHVAMLSVHDANRAFWNTPRNDLLEFRLLASPSSQFA